MLWTSFSARIENNPFADGEIVLKWLFKGSGTGWIFDFDK